MLSTTSKLLLRAEIGLLVIKIMSCTAQHETINYFAYGSNLLDRRLHINIPSAERVGPGKLEGFRLDFNMHSSRWNGAAATIVPTEGSAIWGAVWKIRKLEVDALDKQEGVPEKQYKPLVVNVTLNNKDVIECRTYMQCAVPEFVDIKQLPQDRMPSKIYLETIKAGAMASSLPEDYIKFLNSIPDNGIEESQVGYSIKDIRQSEL